METGNVEGVDLLDIEPSAASGDVSGDYVAFASTGEPAKGEYHCAECGYGVTVYRELPRCPMCGGESWEQSAWSPFARARSILQ
jgi:hypothetical protein